MAKNYFNLGEKQAYRCGYADGMKQAKKQARYQKDCKQSQAIKQNDSKKNIYIELLKNQNEQNRKVI